jgi:hypothetical protein
MDDAWLTGQLHLICCQRAASCLTSSSFQLHSCLSGFLQQARAGEEGGSQPGACDAEPVINLCTCTAAHCAPNLSSRAQVLPCLLGGSYKCNMQ